MLIMLHGRDIVCAAVSSLTIDTVNGLSKLTDAEFNAEVDEVIIQESTAYSNVLLQSMIMSLEGIQ